MGARKRRDERERERQLSQTALCFFFPRPSATLSPHPSPLWMRAFVRRERGPYLGAHRHERDHERHAHHGVSGWRERGEEERWGATRAFCAFRLKNEKQVPRDWRLPNEGL